MGAARILRALFVVPLFLALLTSAPQAHADVADKIFNFLKSKGSYVGINPDGVEMARYLYNYPENGAEVIGRGVAQDYPFFGLVGAVKAAKNKKLPGIGTFTERKCITPITLIDDVFAIADEKISDAGGKQQTNEVIGVASDYAKDYAKAQTAQAKEEVKQELADEIPYFGDIELICHFGFRSDFKAEQDIQKLVTKKVQQARDVYSAFKNEEYGKGAKTLLKMGFAPEEVCDVIDSALDSSGIGKIPGVSELSNGVCKGFTGKVIGTIIDEGVELVEEGAEAVADAACAVYDFFGGECNEDVPAPPSGIGNARAFCSPHGGLKAAKSKTNQPNDFSVVCNNEMACNVKPGQPPRCTTLAQAEKRRLDLANASSDEYRKGVKSFSDRFYAERFPKCLDAQCEGELETLHDEIMKLAKSQHANEPAKPFWQIEMDMDALANQKAPEVIAASIARTREQNKQTGGKNADAFAMLAVGIWSKQCPDQACIDSIQSIGEEYAAEVRKAIEANPELPPKQLQTQVGKKYAKLMKDFTDKAKKEALAANSQAEAIDQMHALDCKKFMGRADQYLCESEQAFVACSDRVNKAEAKLCMIGTKSYGDWGTVLKLLANVGCRGSDEGSGTLGCDNERALKACQRFVDGGMNLICQGG